MTSKKYAGSVVIEGGTLEMLEELMESFHCSHPAAIERAIRIAWETTMLMGKKPPDKLILCVADNCDQPVVTGCYHCRKHLPEGPPAH